MKAFEGFFVENFCALVLPPWPYHFLACVSPCPHFLSYTYEYRSLYLEHSSWEEGFVHSEDALKRRGCSGCPHWSKNYTTPTVLTCHSPGNFLSSVVAKLCRGNSTSAGWTTESTHQLSYLDIYIQINTLQVFMTNGIVLILILLTFHFLVVIIYRYSQHMVSTFNLLLRQTPLDEETNGVRLDEVGGL